MPKFCADVVVAYVVHWVVGAHFYACTTDRNFDVRDVVRAVFVDANRHSQTDLIYMLPFPSCRVYMNKMLLNGLDGPVAAGRHGASIDS